MVPRSASPLQPCLEEVSTPLRAYARRHPLTSMLCLTLAAVIGSADTWVKKEEFDWNHRA